MRERRESSRDVGRHRHTARMEDKRRFEAYLIGFIQFFFPLAVPLEFSAKHIEFLEKLESAILHGGREAVALPRGFGKSTLVVLACIWAVLYGHRRYIAVIAATAKDSRKIIRSFKSNFERNALLLEVFPEACHYIRSLDGQSQRAGGQLANGERTGIMWTTDMLVLPFFERNEEYMERGSQAVIEARGLTGSVRGLNYTTLDGEVIRPELIVLDDPQTRESAKSPEQTATRIELIDGDVLGCAGPGVSLAAIMACTVIAEDDLSEHYLAEWSSVRAALVEQWPEDEEIWDEFKGIYLETKSQGVAEQQKVLNEFYLKNRKRMDAGSEVSWSEWVLAGYTSAIQSAQVKRFELGDAAFFAEYQNKPLKQNANLYTLSTALIMSRLNGLEHRQIPTDAPLLVCAADINYYAISYATAAIRSDFTAHVVDYGWFPDGGCVYDSKTSIVSEEQAIFAALIKFTQQTAAIYPALRVLGIDGNCFTAAVHKFVIWSIGKFPFQIVPLRGMAAKQYREPRQTTPGLYGAPRLRCCMKVNAERIMYAPFDSHYWHMAQQKMWMLAPGSPGSISLFSSKILNHRRFAEQVTADKLRDVYERYGDMIYEWATIGQNEMSDAVTMCMVLANLAGIDPINSGGQSDPAQQPKPKRRKRPVVIMN